MTNELDVTGASDAIRRLSYAIGEITVLSMKVAEANQRIQQLAMNASVLEGELGKASRGEDHDFSRGIPPHPERNDLPHDYYQSELAKQSLETIQGYERQHEEAVAELAEYEKTRDKSLRYDPHLEKLKAKSLKLGTCVLFSEKEKNSTAAS